MKKYGIIFPNFYYTPELGRQVSLFPAIYEKIGMYLDKDNNLEKISTAIASHKMICFSYTNVKGIVKDHKLVVEPFLVGVLKTIEPKIQEPLFLSAWYSATDAEKGKGKTDGWKLYDLNRMGNIVIMEQTFSSQRMGYNKNDSRMKAIIVHI